MRFAQAIFAVFAAVLLAGGGVPSAFAAEVEADPPVAPIVVDDLPENALKTGAPGLLSARLCPQPALNIAPAQPTLGIPGSGGAVYGQTYGENYGGGPGSTLDQSNAILGQNCVNLPGQ
jgi:hypothetical protein